jgi:hypothetical protein
MTQRLRVVSVQRLLVIAAKHGFAVVDGVGAIGEDTLGLGVPVLTARFLREGGLAGERWRAGGSHEDGLEELVEFCLSRASRSARCRS